MTRDELTDDERAFLENYRELDGPERLRVRQRIDELLQQAHEDKSNPARQAGAFWREFIPR